MSVEEKEMSPKAMEDMRQLYEAFTIVNPVSDQEWKKVLKSPIWSDLYALKWYGLMQEQPEKECYIRPFLRQVSVYEELMERKNYTEEAKETIRGLYVFYDRSVDLIGRHSVEDLRRESTTCRLLPHLRKGYLCDCRKTWREV
jgi:hypothetical protein